MVDDEKSLALSADDSWRAKAMLTGGAIGAVLGVVSAILYIRAAEEKHGSESPPSPPDTKDAMVLGFSLLSVIRSIMELGRK